MWVIYSEKNYGRAGGGAGRSLVVFPLASFGIEYSAGEDTYQGLIQQ